MRRTALVALALVAAAGCSSGSPATSGTPAPRSSTTPTATPIATPSASAVATPNLPDRTVWLCDPRHTPNPCTSDLTTTAVLADGTKHPEPRPVTRQRDLDCFYVYPTVSRQSTPNADLHVDAEEVQVAVAQASRFSSACRVWAPMYRQRTVGDLFNLPHGLATSPQNLTAFASVRAAWRDYLAHDNGGRRVVLIGHSQGAAMLIRLLRADIDPDAAVRRNLALAIVLGGNFTRLPHVPLCTHPQQAGCVIAYSTFPQQPPAFSLFGRAGAGVSALAGETSTATPVACVDPAAIGGGSALLHSYYPSSQLPSGGTSTPWTSFPGRYRAQCRSVGSATWLQVTPTGGAQDKRPRVEENLGPAWGFHIVDVNIALGDLVRDVASLPAR